MISLISALNFSETAFAVSFTSSEVMGALLIPHARFVIQLIPHTSNPQCLAACASIAVLIPTASAP